MKSFYTYLYTHTDKIEELEEMTKLLQRAEMELEAELKHDMENGATSQKFSRKKVTVV